MRNTKTNRKNNKTKAIFGNLIVKLFTSIK